MCIIMYTRENIFVFLRLDNHTGTTVWLSYAVQSLSSEFQRWLQFYGKVTGDYELVKGDFLTERDMLDRINSATSVHTMNAELLMYSCVET